MTTATTKTYTDRPLTIKQALAQLIRDLAAMKK